MKFIEVDKDKIAKEEYVAYHNVVKELEEFLSMNVETARIVFDYGEYRSTHSAYEALRKCIRYHNLPIKVMRRGDNIYLTRKVI